MLDAKDVFSAARDEGQQDPYIILSRLKRIGLSDERARKLLLAEGYELEDGVIDARVDAHSCTKAGGFSSKL